MLNSLIPAWMMFSVNIVCSVVESLLWGSQGGQSAYKVQDFDTRDQGLYPEFGVWFGWRQTEAFWLRVGKGCGFSEMVTK